MRSIFANTLLLLAVTVSVCLGADNSLGTWKLDLAKSKAGAMKSLTVTRESVEGGVKVTAMGETNDGTAYKHTFTAPYDGKEVPLTGNATFDRISVKRVDVNTLTDERRKIDGSAKGTARTVISDGGKVMTITIRGTIPQGALYQVFVFDKQ